MYAHIVADPHSDRLRFCCTPSSVPFGDPAARAARVVVVFTTEAETTEVLGLAQTLAAPDAGLWIVCPVSRSPAGWLRMTRFTRFIRRRASLFREPMRDRLRLIAYPHVAGTDPVEEFAGSRSLIVLRTRWWRGWGRATKGITMRSSNASVLL